MGLALHHYHDTHLAFPPGTRAVRDDYPYLAWNARLLPFLDQEPLWRRIVADYGKQSHFAEPIPHFALSMVQPGFICPADGRTDDVVGRKSVAVAFTSYLGVAGVQNRADGMLYIESRVRLADVGDGSGNTLMVGERPPSAIKWLGWWYAGVGQSYDGSADYLMCVEETNRTPRIPTCPKGPYPFSPGDPDDPCATFHFWSLHSGGANFLFADGSVRFLRYSADALLPALATRNGGESVGDID